MKDFKLLINGRLVAGASSIDVINPATEEAVAACPTADKAQLNQAVAAAKAAFPAWSKTPIRERGKLRRKVRAISTEGRMSAYILTAIPALLFAAIMALMPEFYRDVWGVPKTWYLIGGSITWLMLGNLMMFKMSNFRF